MVGRWPFRRSGRQPGRRNRRLDRNPERPLCMSPSLTVVVPIYNVGDYLISCLESLADQTLSDFEVLLVDDGSTDGSGAVADDFAAGRGGWRVLHVQNGGLGRARNVGLDQCSSE